MKNYIAQAKQQGLKWQTLMLEDAEDTIKVLIKNSFLVGMPFGVLRAKIQKVVDDTAKDIEDKVFGEKVRASLFSFSSNVYSKLAATLGIYSVGVIKAVNVITSSLNVRDKKQAKRILQREVIGEDTDYVENAQPLNEFCKTYMKKVEETTNNIIKTNANDSGIPARWSAELKERQDSHLKQLASLKSKGVKLVWTSTHGNCSKRCEPFQGRLWSLDGTSGTIDGISYKPLEVATDIFYTTKKGKTYKNGIISGFGCRHYLIEYHKGNKPPYVSAEVIERERNINQQQRYMERTIRNYRQRYLLSKGIDDNIAKKCRAQAILWNKKYMQYSKENNVAYYPSRLKIFEEELNV